MAQNRRVNPKTFFGELKRRNVYKVAVAYIVAGWALAQGLAQVLPVFNVPNWVIQLLVLLIILGLPIALGLAWAFELTPEGLKRTEEVDAGRSGCSQKARLDLCRSCSARLYRLDCFSSVATRPPLHKTQRSTLQ